MSWNALNFKSSEVYEPCILIETHLILMKNNKNLLIDPVYSFLFKLIDLGFAFQDSLNSSKEATLHEEMDVAMVTTSSDECCHLMANEKAYLHYNQKHELDSYLQHVHTHRHRRSIRSVYTRIPEYCAAE